MPDIDKLLNIIIRQNVQLRRISCTNHLDTVYLSWTKCTFALDLDVQWIGLECAILSDHYVQQKQT